MGNNETTPIRILVVDDHRLVRDGIVGILSAQSGIEVIGQASDGSEAIAKARELGPDVILMDIRMAGMDGLAATRIITQEMPQVRVIILTVSSDEEAVGEAIRAGARGYIGKDVDADDLVRQVRRVIAGTVALSVDMTKKLVTGLTRPPGDRRTSDRAEVITNREREVLTLIAQGKTNKSIADNLSLSEHTVRAHVRSLMQKLVLDNRTQIAVYGLRQGYLPDARARSGDGSPVATVA